MVDIILGILIGVSVIGIIAAVKYVAENTDEIQNKLDWIINKLMEK